MRMKLAFGVGFGLGYYLGSMAGRERYEQINRVARKVKSSDAFQTAEQKAKAGGHERNEAKRCPERDQGSAGSARERCRTGRWLAREASRNRLYWPCRFGRNR